MKYRERLESVRQRVESACQKVGRSPKEVRIIAVTKYVDVDETIHIIHSGATDLGENRAVQAKVKRDAIDDPSTTWHFIGNLQTNKVKDVLPRFDWIHSLDRASLAEELQRQSSKAGRRIKCLVQVNVSGEDTKSGFNPDDVGPFLERALMEYPSIDILGLMTMAPNTNDPESARPFFRALRELRDQLHAKFPFLSLTELSMGMSGDFEVAVEEGATMVRIGSLLFQDE